MNKLNIYLFGKFSVSFKGQNLAGFEARKMQELLFYILLHRDHPHPREIVADLLWSDVSTAKSKNYLRKVLWQLQATLSSKVDPNFANVLLVEPDWIQFNQDAHIWLDVVNFEQAYILTQGRPGIELDSHSAQILQNAVDLYRGELLEGWYLDWCLYERERLQYMYLAMLDKLMAYCEAHHHYETGISYGIRTLRYDRARERTHRRLMRLQYLAGDRTSALRQYERCLSALN